MNEKLIILTAIKNNWATRINREQLVYSMLQQHRINPVVTQSIINNSLNSGEISVLGNGYLIIEQSGREYITEQLKMNLITIEHKIANNPDRVHIDQIHDLADGYQDKEKSPVGINWTKWGAILTAVGIIVAIALDKCKVDTSKQNQAATHQQDKTGK